MRRYPVCTANSVTGPSDTGPVGLLCAPHPAVGDQAQASPAWVQRDLFPLPLPLASYLLTLGRCESGSGRPWNESPPWRSSWRVPSSRCAACPPSVCTLWLRGATARACLRPIPQPPDWAGDCWPRGGWALSGRRGAQRGLGQVAGSLAFDSLTAPGLRPVAVCPAAGTRRPGRSGRGRGDSGTGAEAPVEGGSWRGTRPPAAGGALPCRGEVGLSQRPPPVPCPPPRPPRTLWVFVFVPHSRLGT